MYGVRPEEFTGRGSDYFAFARDDYRGAQQSRIQAAVRAGATEGASLSIPTAWPAAQELCIRRPDGSQRFTLGNEIALGTGKLEALRVLGVSIDITELRSAQVALAESEAKFKQLAEDAVLGIYIIQEGKLAYVNPSLARTFGYLPEEIAGKMTPLDLIHPSDVELLLQRLAERLDGLQVGQTSTYRGVRKDGSEIELEVWGVSVEYHGKPAVQGTLVDVTARRTLERQLLQAQKMESVGRLAGGVAHDFNNMLCVISMGAEAALEKLGASHPVQADLEEILAAARRSTDLTRQLLAFARTQPVAPKVLDLNETVSGMLRMLRRLVGENLSLAWSPTRRSGRSISTPPRLTRFWPTFASTPGTPFPTWERSPSRPRIEPSRACPVGPLGEITSASRSPTPAEEWTTPPGHTPSIPSSRPRRWARVPGSAWRPYMESSSRTPAASTFKALPGRARPSRSTFRGAPARP